MKSILRSTALLSGSSIIGIIVGLFSAKAWAILLGSSGLGYMGLLQSLLGLASMIAGMGIGTGVIRMGANALAHEDHDQVAALRRAGWVLLSVFMGTEILLLIAFRDPVSRWMLGGTEHSNHVILIAAALVFTQVSGFQASLLNTYHRIGALARMAIWNTFLATGSGLLLVWFFGEAGIAPAVLSSAVVLWILAHVFLHREVKPVPAHPTRQATLGAIWSLLRFGGPYTASMVVGMGMQLLLPAVVLFMLDRESVGLYRAALVISLTYLGFLLSAMTQDYYPRVSAASDRPDELVNIVNQQHRLVMLLAVPLILGVQAVAPYLIRIIYSAEFSPAASILEWQLIGDLFKFSSWTMGFVILARSRSTTFFLVELLAGLNIIGMTWLGIHFFGLAGLGVGFLLTYVAHYVVVFLIVRKSIGLVWTRSNKLMMLGAVLATLLIRSLPPLGLESYRLPVALTLAAIAGLGSAVVIYREIGGKEYVSTWKPAAFLLRGRKGSAPVDSVKARQIETNYATFQRHVDLAERYLQRGRYRVAAVYAQIAAKFAAGNHPGLFTSSRLERVLCEIGRRGLPVDTSPNGAKRTAAVPERVLHVFTQVGGVGGHTRMAWRWIEYDLERSHSVAITMQGSADVPGQLTAIVEKSEGDVHILDSSGNLLTWASRLRMLAERFDVVILHINPDDVIPIIAFGDHSLSARIIFVNHADQLFWLGTSISDVVANARETGANLSVTRRGIEPDRCAMLPIPLPDVHRKTHRAEAKRRLGLPEDGVLLLSIARPHKYAVVNGVTFIGSLLPVVERFPNVQAIVIGPGNDATWAKAAERTNGRLRTIGLRWDTADYYEAADIYVDSYPVASTTSLLEAGSYGLPLVSRHQDGTGSTVLCADTPALTRHMLGAGSLEEFHRHLAELIEDETYRLIVGAAIRDDIEHLHTGGSWKTALLQTYELAGQVARLRTERIDPDECRKDTVDLLLPLHFPREPDLDLVTQFNLRQFPFDVRCRVWWRMSISTGTFRPGLLLSQSAAIRLEKWLSSRTPATAKLSRYRNVIRLYLERQGA